MKKLFYFFFLAPFILIAQNSHVVVVGPGMNYLPSELSISQGDTVYWVSAGGTHDVNFDINSITNESFGNPAEIADASLPILDLGEISYIIFNSLGTFNYDCSVGSHAALGMTGSISVIPSQNCVDDDEFVASVFGSFSITSCAQVVDYLIPTFGYTNEQACAWDGAPSFDLGGMTVADYCECYCEQTIDDVLGCTNSDAANFNSNATQDDGSCEFNIASSSQITTCGGIFVDSGGSSGDYSTNENQSITIYPENPNEFVSLSFTEFQLEGATYDNLSIYDGIDISAPVLINAVGNSELLNQTIYASESNESGALTVIFTSDGSFSYSGWVADIGCTIYGPCFGFGADVLTTYETEVGASDASATVNLTLGNEPFEYLWSTGENTQSISGLTSGSYSVTVTDSEDCVTETFFDIIVDPLEYTIDQLDVLTSCGGTLYDSGGSNGDYTSNENQSITIYPENTGEYVSLFFSAFQFETCCDYLTIYDGTSTTSPILVPQSNGTSLADQTYYASPTNETGALTVTFTSDISGEYSGWAAQIGCTTYGPCFGFGADVLTTYETEVGASDASATVNLTLGNEPFQYLWSSGESTQSISDLTTGSYSVTVTDSEDCVTETFFDIIVDPLEYNIDESEAITSCGGTLYDSGGPEGTYSASESQLITIFPENSFEYVTLNFTQFNLESSLFNLYDYISIYDGNNINAPVLVDSAAGSLLLDSLIVASENNQSGALTLTFNSDLSGQYDGWAAQINCTTYTVYGCMDPQAFNYLEEAQQDDGSCYYAPGCTDSNFVEYYSQGFIADFDNGSCLTVLVDDCLDPVALNYNPSATYNLELDPCIYSLDDWVCGMYFKDERDGYSYPTVSIVEQCWMAENLRYTSPGSSEIQIPAGGVASQLEDGFIYSGVDAYNLNDNGRYYSWNSSDAAVPYSWHLPSVEEFQTLLSNFSSDDLLVGGQSGLNIQLSGGALIQDDQLAYASNGSTCWLWSSTEVDQNNASAVQIVQGTPNVVINSISKEYGISIRALFGFPEDAVLGCSDDDYVEYNPQATYDDGSCETLAVEGCTDYTALNYDSLANVNDGSCIVSIEGCTDSAYYEYNASANVDDGSCLTPVVYGCTDENSQNFDANANTDDGSCIPHILGCTDDFYAEYNANATSDDGSCLTPAIFGCTNPNALNYDVNANVDDGSCTAFTEGCTDPNYVEYNAQANFDDGSCSIVVIYGCTIDYALNYNSIANTDDGSCQVEGCTDNLYVEFDINANIEDGSCEVIAIFGCTNSNYLEYYPPANLDDGSCLNVIVEGCTDSLYLEYTTEANLDDGSCELLGIIGCTDPNYLEYDSTATIDLNTCITPVILGCTDLNYTEYNSDANTEDGSCETIVVMGCTDSNFMEYNTEANVDDGSCTFIILEGCMDENYVQYNPLANIEDNSCETLVVMGCTDVFAFNYDSLANTDDGLCVPVVNGCIDDSFLEYNPIANIEDETMCVTPVVMGCNDEEAVNHNPESNTNDGSCIYYFAEISYMGFADGIVHFTPTIEGMGNNYQTYWSFGDGFYSNDYSPTHTYTENGLMEVILTVNNGQIEIITSISIQIINAAIGINEKDQTKRIVSTQHYDLLGKTSSKKHLINYQIYICKITYDDGSYEFLKKVGTN